MCALCLNSSRLCFLIANIKIIFFSCSNSNSHDDDTKENQASEHDIIDATGAFQRSKSNEIFKKDFLMNESRRSSSHFNSLKQWGKNRFKIINRLSGDSTRGSLRVKTNSNDDIDDFNVIEAISKRQKKINEKDRKHDRKSCYSSDDRSEGSTAHTSSSTQKINSLAHPVRMREPTLTRKQRKRGPNDEPHSSSGNWSASSESGRASIESEITSTTVTQPKSSTSNSSLNYTTHTYPSSSGPPSSIISRRRFMNTSASSSIASEGTATPEMQQMFDIHDEGETSSVYSCDTEGYYTSFHVDSGLKTLKEEEPMTPNHSTTALSSTNSFESSGNQTVISPECEYELFGKGSTTTSSSAGTVCTAVMHLDYDRPSVPERKSSLGKLNRTDSTSSWGNLLRSPSTSTVGSTLEKGATIKRNGVLLQKEVQALVHQHAQQEALVNREIESPDSGNNTSSSPVDSNSSPTNQNARVCSEFECSESSDLECIERTERIKEKTTININRIPSMCVITPTPSDDDEAKHSNKHEDHFNTQHEPKQQQKTQQSHDKDAGYASVIDLNANRKQQQQPRKNGPLNMIGKLRGVLQPLMKSPSKDAKYAEPTDEYVTISELKTPSKSSTKASNGIYYSSEVLKRNLATVLSGNLTDETEYVSLNELPCNARSESNLLVDGENQEIDNQRERGDDKRNRVKFDAHGKPIFDSSSLKRKKGAITSFNPGHCVKDSSAVDVKSSNKVAEELPKAAIDAIEPKNLIESPIYRRPLLSKIRPVIAQKSPQKKSENSEIVTESNNNSIRIIEQTTMSTFSDMEYYEKPSGALAINLNSTNSNKVLSNGTRGAYMHLPEAATMFNGPPAYSPPSPSCSSSVYSTSSEGKQMCNDKSDGKKFLCTTTPTTPKIIDYTPKKMNDSNVAEYNSEALNENNDPNMAKMRGGRVKRRNSYRMAAIYADPSSLIKSIENMNLKNSTFSLTTSDKCNNNSIVDEQVNLRKPIRRSFEKLIEEFTKTSSNIIYTDLMLNESLKDDKLNYSPLENSNSINLDEYMTDSAFDEEFPIIMEKKCLPKIHIPSPKRVTIPRDRDSHKARILRNSNSSQCDTEIW